MKNRWRFSIRWLLTALLALVTLALGLSITALSFNRMRAASLASGEQLISVTGNAVNGAFGKIRLEITGAMASATGSRLARAQTFEARAGARDDLVPMLLVNRLVTSARAAFPNGDEFTLRRVRPSDRLGGLTARGVYIILGGRAAARGAEVRYWLYDANMRPLAAGTKPASYYYNPRTRPWFNVLTNVETFSAPYLSKATSTVVFSISQRTFSGAVFDVDIELSGYSELLRQLRPTPSAIGAVIRTADNVVLAFSDIAALEEDMRRNGGNAVVLSQLRSAPLVAAIASDPHFVDSRASYYRDANGRTWLWSTTPVRSSAGYSLGRTIVLAAPEDEFLAAARRERDAALMLCLGIVLATIPIAFLLSKILAEPIDVLRRDAITLRNLDFSPQPRPRSIISEIDEFSETFGTMRRHVKEYNDAVARFVPRAFLETLGRRDITSLQLGDHSQGAMTLLFAYVRSFTTLASGLSPEDTFRFVNTYLSEVGPIVREHGGFVDKYIGDAIMALFPKRPGDAVDAAIAMQRRLTRYNAERAQSGYDPIAVGIGIHRGPLMLGTIGEEQRFETTVIADAVNVAARLGGLTNAFGSSIVASDEVVCDIDSAKYRLRDLGEILVKGATHPVTVYEICDADPDDVLAYKMAMREQFEEGRTAYFRGDFSTSVRILSEIAGDGRDRAAAYYRDRAAEMTAGTVATAWDGVERMERK